MSTLTSYASASARDSAAPAASNTGLCIFRSDTKAIEVSDGTNYLIYNNDGITYDFSASNTHSGVFDGAGDYFDIGGPSQLNASSNFSFAGFFNFDGTSLETLFGAAGDSSNRIWGMVINSTTIRIGIGAAFDDFTVSTLSTGTWYHIAYSISGTSCTLYLDKTSQGSATVNSLTSTTFNNFRIGGLPTAGGAFGGLNPFDGYMDEIAIFDYALSGTQVANIYDNKFYISPVAVYRLENDVTDETGNYDGTNNGVTFSTSVKPY